MELIHHHIKGVVQIFPVVLEDERGQFFRFYCKDTFSQFTDKEFIQQNHSVNAKKGTLRGMHYQLPPFSEQKLVRCIRGSIQDVFVDLRKNSPTFLSWGSVVLDERKPSVLFLPEGIAHGFLTLEDDTQILYQHSENYMPQSEAGLRFDDPALNIEWMIRPTIVSKRDFEHPLLTDNFKGLEL